MAVASCRLRMVTCTAASAENTACTGTWVRKCVGKCEGDRGLGGGGRRRERDVMKVKKGHHTTSSFAERPKPPVISTIVALETGEVAIVVML